MPFTKAVKHESKLRLALAGPAGSGKTYTALAVATALADGQGVALIDTERGSASKYADLFSFDVLNLSAPYHPDRFVEAMAEASGYGVLILDSLSHAWNGPGGLLEIVETISKRNKGGNSYAAWADATPIQNRLIDALTNARTHVIVTLRSKQDYAQEKDEKTGRTVIRKLGMAPIQRDGVEYEFDVFGDMNMDNELIIQKSRCSALAGAVIAKPGAQVAETLKSWLSGVAPADPWEAPRALAKTFNYTQAQWKGLVASEKSPERALAFLEAQAARLAAEEESDSLFDGSAFGNSDLPADSPYGDPVGMMRR